MADEGRFLTGSGSKIPMPRKDNVAVVAPQAALQPPPEPPKPQLAMSSVINTNYVDPNCEENAGPSTSAPDHVNQVAMSSVKNTHNMGCKSEAPVVVKQVVSQAAGPRTNNLRQGVARSIPNLKTASLAVSRRRSKTFMGPVRKGPLQKTQTATRAGIVTAKRPAASAPAPEETPAAKQVKTAPRTGLPYKAKNWELKARLAECEEWLLELREKHAELERENSSHLLELDDWHQTKGGLQENIRRLETEVAELNAEDRRLKDSLRSKTQQFEQLREDSKDFVSKIDKLEAAVAQRDQQLSTSQGDVSKLREDVLAKDSLISQLKYKTDDLEFSTRRQKNQIEDLERELDKNRVERNELQSKLRDLQDTTDKAERENRMKTTTISDLEVDLTTTRSQRSNLQALVSELQTERDQLKTNLEDTTLKFQQKTSDAAALFVDVTLLTTKLCESEKLRRYLHNTVQDLKGNIRVFCRVRPPITSEKENSSTLCSLNFPDEGSLEISKGEPTILSNSNSNVSRPKFAKHEFSFDRVFTPGSTQEDVFSELSQLVQSALDGYNVCVFAYGQTGSGKTYTMEGPNESARRGMIPRTVEHIFSTVADLKLLGWTYTVEVSFLEIYNEVIRDLLRTDKDGSGLKIMQVDGRTNDVTIPGLTVTPVTSYEDLDRLYLLAHQNRAVASTACNERSSRSHSVTKIRVTGVHQDRGETSYGSLYLVDLAGSERLNEPMAVSDPRFREMKNINKSLSELGNVILGLMQKNEHIPFRNSKLTHLLQPALGGSSKTLMLVNISPAENCMQETLCSLRFAEKVNKVKMTTMKKRVVYDQNLKM